MKPPESIQVIERGWLSNNVVLHARTGAVVVDSGYGTHVPQTLALLERVLAGKSSRACQYALIPIIWAAIGHSEENGCRTSIPG
jgi:hypothetical protein